MAVAYDNFVKVTFGGVATITTGSFTITSSANRAALMNMSFSTNAATGISGSVAGVSGTAITGTDSGAAELMRSLQFGVIAPGSGSQTGTMSWTTNRTGTLGVVTASGVDQTTAFNNGTFAQASPNTTLAVTITSTSGDLTADNCATQLDTFTLPTQTEIYNDTATTDYGCSSRGPGSGNTTHSWTSTGTQTTVISGCNFVQSSGAAAVYPIDNTAAMLAIGLIG